MHVHVPAYLPSNLPSELQFLSFSNGFVHLKKGSQSLGDRLLRAKNIILPAGDYPNVMQLENCIVQNMQYFFQQFPKIQRVIGDFSAYVLDDTDFWNSTTSYSFFQFGNSIQGLTFIKVPLGVATVHIRTGF